MVQRDGETLMGYTAEEIQVFGAQALGIEPSEYQEIVGVDRTRGGGGAVDLVGAAQVLSALHAGGGGADAIARRAAGLRPAVRGIPLTRMNEVQVPIVVFGTTSQTPSATIQLQQLFRPEKLIVTEQTNANAFNNPAQGQILTGAFVGAQNMFPTAPGVGSGIHAGTFSSNSLGNGIMWATARPAITITLQVNFLQTGTFWGCMLGKTLS